MAAAVTESSYKAMQQSLIYPNPSRTEGAQQYLNADCFI